MSSLKKECNWHKMHHHYTFAAQKVNIKVRQPLQKVLIPALDKNMKAQLQKVEDLIKAEVNVKEMEYLNPDNTFISKKINPILLRWAKNWAQR
jgi:isoleucyl-tRNA synthetase